jgi:excinuclease ABC subunit A
MTDPREQTSALADLPTGLPDLCAAVQGLLLHPLLTHLYSVDLTRIQRKEVSIRPAAEIIALARKLDSRPLDVARLPPERVVGNCRDLALLLCSFLRFQGRAARLRAGFAVYLGGDLVHDHWICEVWQPEETRWRQVDPQIDALQRAEFKIAFDPSDLPAGQFLSAAQVWNLCRKGKAKSGQYGLNRKLRGWNFIRNSVLLDLAALNKIELLPTDLWWDLCARDDKDLSPEERELIDRIAGLAQDPDPAFEDLRLLYENDPRLSGAVSTRLKLLGLLGEAGREPPAAQVASAADQGPALLFQPSDRQRLASLGTNGTAGLDVVSPAEVVSTLFLQNNLPSADPDHIVVRGASEHNLKHVDVSIPRNKLVVITGVSGSGKSTLAFDTLYAEGQRRYVESLSSYVRRYLEQMDKPKVDYIGGLSPAISIEQKTVSRNPRSTVGTVTEVMDYLRVLFSRAGTQHCPQCGRAIEPVSPQQAVEALACLTPGTRFQLIAPLVRGKKGDHSGLLETARREGFTRARVDGETLELLEGTSLPKLAKGKAHTIEIIVDRLSVPPADADSTWHKDYALRLIDSVETAYRAGRGLLRVDLGGVETLLLSRENVCPHCEISMPALTPGLFSFNAPSGMCAACNGLGTRMEIDVNLIVEHPELSLLDGASRWLGNIRKKGGWHTRHMQSLADHYGVNLEVPWKDLPQKFRDVILWGSNGEKIQFKFEANDGSWKGETNREERGAVFNINRLFRQTQSEYTRRWYGSFMSRQPCPACGGSRLCAEARHVTVGGRGFAEVLEMTIEQAYAWICELTEKSLLTSEQIEVIGEVLKELRSRLRFMLNVGLHYLSLSRPAPTLSGGEGQRIRLASQLGCGLVGVLYILDEPSIGLHSRDQRSLLDTLLHLRDQGNTVLVVEHDAETMHAADWLIDMGPGAGIKGGCLVAEGTPAQVATNPASLTGRYLSGALRVTAPNAGQPRRPRGWLTLSGARLWNLKNVTARIPLGTVICVTGVSGSGKSSLVSETLYPALARALMGAQTTPGPYDRLDGLNQLDKVIDITQDPIGRTPRSNPATYVGIFDEIRKVFSAVPEARARGYTSARFSFNVRGGRCEACAGHGLKRIEMHFLPDVWVTCQECKGKRYNRHTLEITYKGKNIAEVLDMDVQEALEFFAPFPAITRMLQTLHDVGLDYVKLGQSATTLSGGEAQRVKLAKELGREATGDTIYILDEPTTGLHFADVQRLLDVLHRLAGAGNTVVVIEHNLDVIKTSDWIVDLGPEGGQRGGYILAEGTPEEVARVESSYTGRFLREQMLTAPLPA